jgi:phosphatidylserine/phosphatidylglycerophosphate/cardiolipin synthase-like enzyme
VELLEGAETSIHMMIYQLGWSSDYVDILIEKAEAGLEVAVIMHDPDGSLSADNQDAQDQMAADLSAAGVDFQYQPAEFSDEYDFYHVKSVVVDRERAWLSTGNLVPYFMERERNIDVWDDDPADVADILEIFAADAAGRSPDLDCTRLVVSPENARERIVALIDSAEESLVIHSMQLKDDDVRAAIAARAAAGVDVRVLLAYPGWIADNSDAADYLAANGVDARYQEYPDTHIKLVLVDDAAAYVGSVNLSWNSLTNNREIGVLLWDDAAITAIGEMFDGDWTDGTAF